ncbi:MAG: 5'-nucleotidase, partial [uncultured Thermomicrobiales bacterium]
AGRADGGLLPQADRDLARPQPVPPLLHLDLPPERVLRRLRLRRRLRLAARLRGDAGGRLPDGDRRRLRPPRGPADRRGDLRRAGADVGGRPRRLPAPHRRGPRRRTRPAAARHAGHGRVQPPVPGPGLADGDGRRRQPLLRRPERRRHPRRAGRAARGLHRGRLRARRPDAHARPGPARRRGDDLRHQRPRLRARVLRRQRRPRAPGGGRQRGRAERQLPRGDPTRGRTGRDARRRGRGRAPDRAAGEGLLGRRHRPDLPQRRRPRPDRRDPRGGGRRRPRADRRRLRGVARPRAPGARGRRPGDDGRGATRRRRQRLAPPEPDRRRGGGAQPALPVRRRDSGRADRAVGVLRPARLPAGAGRPREQRQHARHLPRRRAGDRPVPRAGGRRAGHRRGADRRLPARHPRAAQRPRPDPLRDPRGRGGPARGDDPRRQRLPRPDRAPRSVGRRPRRRGQRQPELRRRRRGLPAAVARPLPGRGAARDDHDRRRRLDRRHPADLGLLQRHADDRADERDGLRRRRARQPQLRRQCREPDRHHRAARRVPLPLRQHPRRRRQPRRRRAVADRRLRRRDAGPGRVQQPRHPEPDPAGRARAVRRRGSDPAGQRGGGAGPDRGGRPGRRRLRPLRGHRRHDDRPDRAADRPRGPRDRRRRGDRRPHQLLGRHDAPERGAGDREPEQGRRVHPDAAGRRPHHGRGGLQDRRPPPAVERRGHARPGDPGPARRAERGAPADPRHPDRRGDRGDPAGRRLRQRERADLREPGRQRRHRRDADHLRHRRRDHQLGRAAGGPDLPGGRQPRRLLRPGRAGQRDHPRPGARGAALRQRGQHGRDHRHGAEGLPRERGRGDAGGGRRLPAGLGALLQLRHHRRAGLTGHERGPPGRGRELHRGGARPHRRDDLHAGDERLHGRRRRRLPGHLRARHDAGPDGPGDRGLHRRAGHDRARDPGPDHLRGRRLPGGGQL